MIKSFVLERLAEPGRLPSGVIGFFGPDAEGGPRSSLSGLGWGGRFGALRQSLEPPDFVVELLDQTEQRVHQRSLLLRRDLDSANRASVGLPCHTHRRASRPNFVKAGFHRVIEK